MKVQGIFLGACLYSAEIFQHRRSDLTLFHNSQPFVGQPRWAFSLPKGEAENAIVNTSSKKCSEIFTGYKKTTGVCVQSQLCNCDTKLGL